MQMVYIVTFKGSQYELELGNERATVLDLVHAAAAAAGIGGAAALADETVRVVLRGGRSLRICGDDSAASLPLAEAGVAPGARVTLVASLAAEVAAVRAAREPARMRAFDDDDARAAARAGAGAAVSLPGRRQNGASSPPPTPGADCPFLSFEVLQGPRLDPPPAQALALLHRLAADAGIRAVMARRGWRVGALAEMPPEGKVGVDPVCVLGLNVNAGARILLRLRTDDMRGFRKYDIIRTVLVHELAHNVHSGHGPEFKQLNSELLKEVSAVLAAARAPGRVLDEAAARWRRRAGAGGGDDDGEFYSGVWRDERAIEQQQRESDGRRRLGGGDAGIAALVPARAAAGAAALQRFMDGGRAAAAGDGGGSDGGSSDGGSSGGIATETPPTATAAQAPASALAEQVTDGIVGMAVDDDDGGAGAAAAAAAVDSGTAQVPKVATPAAGASPGPPTPPGSEARGSPPPPPMGGVIGADDDGSTASGSADADTDAVVAAKIAAARAAAAALRAEVAAAGAPATELAASLSALEKAVSNVVVSPAEPRFQTLRLSNASVALKIGRWRAARELLRLAGFEERGSGEGSGGGGSGGGGSGVDGGGTGPALVWARRDPGLAWLVLSAVREAAAAAAARGV